MSADHWIDIPIPGNLNFLKKRGKLYILSTCISSYSFKSYLIIYPTCSNYEFFLQIKNISSLHNLNQNQVGTLLVDGYPSILAPLIKVENVCCHRPGCEWTVPILLSWTLSILVELDWGISFLLCWTVFLKNNVGLATWIYANQGMCI